MQNVKNLEKVFKALGCEPRLWILWLLSQSSLCVCEIMGILGITQTTASRHLGYLRNAGLVESKRQEQWMIYYLRKDLPSRIKEIVDQTIKAISELPEAKIYKERLKSITSDESYRLNRVRR